MKIKLEGGSSDGEVIDAQPTDVLTIPSSEDPHWRTDYRLTERTEDGRRIAIAVGKDTYLPLPR